MIHVNGTLDNFNRSVFVLPVGLSSSANIFLCPQYQTRLVRDNACRIGGVDSPWNDPAGAVEVPASSAHQAFQGHGHT